MRFKKRKRKQMQPMMQSWISKTKQYKILYIIPDTVTNTESVAHENSLRNVNWKTLFPTPQLLMGRRGRGGLLITTPYYKEREQWPGTFETANNPTSTWTSSPRSPCVSTKNGNIGPPNPKTLPPQSTETTNNRPRPHGHWETEANMDCMRVSCVPNCTRGKRNLRTQV